MSLLKSFCVVGCVMLVSGAAWAVDLDLGNLAKYNYSGKTKQSHSGCYLSVSSVARDFGGRLYQDFRIWVDGRSELNFKLRSYGGDRIRSPLRIVGENSIYSISLDVYNLELASDSAQPEIVKGFRLIDTTSVSAPGIVLIDCQFVSSSAR